jgi:hypothetical protein
MTPTTNGCISLIVHFGEPEGCDEDIVQGEPSQIESAILAPFGDITFTFNTGCLEPGQGAIHFYMFTTSAPKLGTVTVIDNYSAPGNGQPAQSSTSVAAYVPDIPPDPPPWLYPVNFPFPYPFFQGLLSSNNVPFGLLTGSYQFQLQLQTSLSGNVLAVTPAVTQTVQVVNGLFNVPMPFDPISMSDGADRWLNISVRPDDPNLPAVQFTPITPLQINPTPQAFYAYTAGVVADLSPGQAVTSLNGLTDTVNLQAGNGIALAASGNTITISAPGANSDRNIKTDFAGVNAETILDKLAALSIQSWRYTNEVAGVRHVGPMAQDFKSAFGLGSSDKIIGFVDEEGVALAAIQGLNQKLEAQAKEKDAQIAGLKQQNQMLEKRLDNLEQAVKSIQQTK